MFELFKLFELSSLSSLSSFSNFPSFSSFSSFSSFLSFSSFSSFSSLNFPKLVFGHLQSYFLLCSSFSRQFIFDTTMMKNLFPLLFLLFFVTSIHGLQEEENSLMTFTPDTNARGIYGNHVGALRIGTYKSLSLSTALTRKYLFWAIFLFFK